MAHWGLGLPIAAGLAYCAGWGVVGWSMGGTCAIDLTVMHPDMFSTFDDIGGDRGPNSGTKQQTINRLYGGDAAAWLQFSTVPPSASATSSAVPIVSTR